MPELPQSAPSINVGLQIGTRLPASNKGQGLAQLGASIQKSAGALDGFFDDLGRQRQQTMGIAAAGEHMVGVLERIQDLKLNADDPDVLHKDIQGLLKDATTLDPALKERLGRHGVDTFTRSITPQLVNHAQGLFNFEVKYRQQHLTAQVATTTENTINAIATSPFVDQGPMIQQFLEYREGLDTNLLPNRDVETQEALMRLTARRADRLARNDPDALERILDEGGRALAIETEAFGTINLDEQTIDALYTKLNTERNAEYTKADRARQERLRTFEKTSDILEANITRLIIDGQTSPEVIDKMIDGYLTGIEPGERPLFSAQQGRTAKDFQHSIARRRAMPPVDPDPTGRVEAALTVQAYNGQIDDPQTVSDNLDIGPEAMRRVLSIWQSERTRRESVGGSAFNGLRKRGEDFLESQIALNKDLWTTVDPEGESLTGQLLVEYHSALSDIHNEILNDETLDAAATERRLREFDVEAFAQNFLRRKVSDSGVLQERVRIRTKRLKEVLRPYAHAEDFARALHRDVERGELTVREFALIHRFQEEAQRRGLTVRQVFDGTMEAIEKVDTPDTKPPNDGTLNAFLRGAEDVFSTIVEALSFAVSGTGLDIAPKPKKKD